VYQLLLLAQHRWKASPVVVLLTAADAELRKLSTVMDQMKRKPMKMMPLDNLRFAGSVHLSYKSLAHRDDPLLS
jgi:hypothetical protein